MNEKQQQQKPSWRFSQAKAPLLGVFVELAPNEKNDYRSVTSIAIISDIIFHMVAILTCNKGDG